MIKEFTMRMLRDGKGVKFKRYKTFSEFDSEVSKADKTMKRIKSWQNEESVLDESKDLYMIKTKMLTQYRNEYGYIICFWLRAEYADNTAEFDEVYK